MDATNAAPSDWRSQLALTPRDFRRADDWLRRTGGMVGTNPDAWLFFVARLRQRRRTGMRLGAAVALIFAADIAVDVWRGWGDQSFGGAQMALVFILVGAFCVVSVTRENRASTRLAAVIGTRTTRERDISLVEVLGRIRLVAFTIVFAAQSCFVVAVFLDAPAPYGADVALLFVVEWSTVVTLVTGSVRRPAIAIDAESLPWMSGCDRGTRACPSLSPTWALRGSSPWSTRRPMLLSTRWRSALSSWASRLNCSPTSRGGGRTRTGAARGGPRDHR